MDPEMLSHGWGVSAKFWKATISFVMSVRLYVCPSGRTEQLDGFSWKLNFEVFWEKIHREISSVIKRQENYNRYFTWGVMYIHENISLNSFSSEKKIQSKFVQKIKTHILSSICFLQNCFVRSVVRSLFSFVGSSRMATNDNTIQNMRFACHINKATRTRTRNIYLLTYLNIFLLTYSLT